MNERYFGYKKGKKYTKVGYRWVYWQLEEPGIVRLGQVIDVDAVLNETGFWNLPSNDNNSILVETLKSAKKFLIDHLNDEVMYFDEDYLFSQWESGYEWKELK